MVSVKRSATRRNRWTGEPTEIVVALLALAALAETIGRAIADGTSVSSSFELCLLALATTLPLAFLGPFGAAVVVSAASVLSLAAFDFLTVAGLGAQLLVLYGCGREASQRKIAPWLATGLAVPFVVLALIGRHPTASDAAVLTLVLAASAPAAGWAGMAVRARHDALDHRAARQVIAGTLLEHTARGERARIARELHDVVAHHISMVAVQAETARLTTPGMPAAGAQRLLAIGDTARTALLEMRRLLGVLREDTPDDLGDRQPQPGLARINELLDEARDASGALTRLVFSGFPIALDPGVELAAYRIAQEALTNARRHAPGAAVDVELHYLPDALWLRVRDNGPGPPEEMPTGGLGLAGMQERAAAVGGRLRTGPAPGGGFAVEATLPGKAETPA
jgi:signal transduction histidine kinase